MRRITQKYGGSICRHCNKRAVQRPRGLCWQCYYAPGVQALYPSTSKFALKGAAHSAATGEAEPTDALPGTEDKIAVMVERAATGRHIFHGDDAAYTQPARRWIVPLAKITPGILGPNRDIFGCMAVTLSDCG